MAKKTVKKEPVKEIKVTKEDRLKAYNGILKSLKFNCDNTEDAFVIKALQEKIKQIKECDKNE